MRLRARPAGNESHVLPARRGHWDTRTVRRVGQIGSELMKRFLVPWAVGVGVARHLAWYISYQISGETRSNSRS
jgi:hypothetical protein